MAKRKTQHQLSIERLKRIRPFVQFDFKIPDIKAGRLSEYDHRKIKKYADAIKHLNTRGAQLYRPRSEKGHKAAKDHIGVGLQELAVYPIRTPEEQKARIRLTKTRGLEVITEHTIKMIVPFNFALLDTEEIDSDPAELESVAAEIARLALDQIPDDFDRFQLITVNNAGISDSQATKKRLAAQLEAMLSRPEYNASAFIYAVAAYKLRNQATPAEYKAAKAKAARAKSRAQNRKRRSKRK